MSSLYPLPSPNFLNDSTLSIYLALCRDQTTFFPLHTLKDFVFECEIMKSGSGAIINSN